MSDGRSIRKAKIVPFLDRLERDRAANLNQLVEKSKILELEGFESIDWNTSQWAVTAGRLLKLSGKNTKSLTLNFNYSPRLGGGPLLDKWGDVAKALMCLRFHRKHQAAPNQRNFITAVGYVAYESEKLGVELPRLTLEVIDNACRLISEHYSAGFSYNLHKAVGEFAKHCDVNGLCRVVFNYKYSAMKRPDTTTGVGYKRLDDPEVLNTKSDKLVTPAVFKIIGELYRNVPNDHKYRFYVLMLTMMACLGRRFSEITLLPYQTMEVDTDGRAYLEYFPRKISQGDVFTPRRKLYMPTDVVPIVEHVIDELNDLCREARITAEVVQNTNQADLSFLRFISSDQRLYGEDLERLGLSATLLDITGWIRKHGYAKPDMEKKTKQNRLAANPFYYTTLDGVIGYCKKDFSENLVQPIHIDQAGKKYYLKDLLFVRYQGMSSGAYSQWIATQCSHAMLTRFLRYFPDLAREYASTAIEVDFTSHHFRHTLNTLLDEGGLSDLLQTEWFGRSNPRDTKAYQHTSREKRALMLREDIKMGLVGGHIAEQLKIVPVGVQEAFLKARVNAVHDVGTGICIHNFAQTPCERHLQCSADCVDYVWVKEDSGRLEELKRQYAMTITAREIAEERSKSSKPKKSADWLTHNEKKLKVLSRQLVDNGVAEFDPKAYLEQLTHD